FPSLVYMLMGMGTPREEAKDIAMQTLLRIFEKYSNGSEEQFADKISGKLPYTIARNIWVDQQRSLDKRKTIALTESEKDPQQLESKDILQDKKMIAEEESQENEKLVRRLPTAFRNMTEVYRDVIQLYYMEQLTHREIAARLGVSTRTSKRYLKKGEAELRNTLETIHNVGEGDPNV
ncbi:RNA polymerase sigma factor, partial [Candidatus Poribacteria bacterium]